MANNHFSAYIYRKEVHGITTDFAPAGGLLNSFPSSGTRFYPADAGTTAGKIPAAINSIIEVLPTGLNIYPALYYTGATVADLNTAAT